MKNRTTYIDENLLVSPSSAMTDERVRVFQRKLFIRAKQEKGFKAYSLKDKLCLDYVHIEAWRRVRQNYSKGTGVDKISFSDIENYGLHKFLSELQTGLRTGTYQCSAVRNVEIPKEKKDEYRILGIHLCYRRRPVRLGKVCALENPCENSMKNSIGKPYEREVRVVVVLQ